MAYSAYPARLAGGGLYLATLVLCAVSAVAELAWLVRGLRDLELVESMRGLGAEMVLKVLVVEMEATLWVRLRELLAYLAAGIACSVVALCWLHRARRNLDDLGAEGLEYSPGATVAWFFVPVANLWLPWVATSQLWKASADPQGRWDQAGPGWVPVAWWATWLLSNLGAAAAFWIGGGIGPASSVDDILFSSQLQLAMVAAHLVSTGLFVLLVMGVQRRQAQALRRLRRAEAAARVAEAAEAARLARERAGAAAS